MWAYGYEGEETSVTGRTRSYQRQDGGDIMFHACAICHCITHFAGTDTDANGRRRIAVNLRMVAPEMIADIPMRLFDGFGAFEERPSDGRCVRDMWV